MYQNQSFNWVVLSERYSENSTEKNILRAVEEGSSWSNALIERGY